MYRRRVGERPLNINLFYTRGKGTELYEFIQQRPLDEDISAGPLLSMANMVFLRLAAPTAPSLGVRMVRTRAISSAPIVIGQLGI